MAAAQQAARLGGCSGRGRACSSQPVITERVPLEQGALIQTMHRSTACTWKVMSAAEIWLDFLLTGQTHVGHC
jgi:hypothetical protein